LPDLQTGERANRQPDYFFHVPITSTRSWHDQRTCPSVLSLALGMGIELD
jgi:hypothetical protein